MVAVVLAGAILFLPSAAATAVVAVGVQCWQWPLAVSSRSSYRLLPTFNGATGDAATSTLFLDNGIVISRPLYSKIYPAVITK